MVRIKEYPSVSFSSVRVARAAVIEVLRQDRSRPWSVLSAAFAVACVAATVCLAPERAVAQGAGKSANSAAGGYEDGHRFPLKGLPDLVLPKLDAVKGRGYFASRACVVCHSVNGIGGTDAAALDLDTMPDRVDVLGFVARMWRGGTAMFSVQRRVLGEQIDLTPEELAAIIAFLHNPAEQNRFSVNDIPKFIRDFMEERKKAKLR